MDSPPPASPLPLDQILPGDCRQLMRDLPDASVDLVFADPPYNLQLRGDLYRPDLSRVEAVTDGWDRFDDLAAYDQFTRQWLAECQRVLKPTGALWVIGSYHNIFRVGSALMDLGFWILNDVAWVKANPTPQFRGVRFTNAHESLIWATRSAGQKRYTFHYKLAKALNGGKQMRSDWYIPVCNGRERLRSNGSKVHTTQKPEALLERIIRICSSRGDVVLDPFSGSGTSAVVCKRWGRRFIGMEMETVYIEAARARIQVVEELPPDALELATGVPPPARVPFQTIVNQGLLKVGDPLRFGRSGPVAKIEEGGILSWNDNRGSIHRIGSLAAGTPACNGWEHWHYQDPETGEYHPINALRQQIREREA